MTDQFAISQNFEVERLAVRVYPDRQAMGKAAGEAAGERIVRLQQSQDEVRIVFAAAPSQLECLKTLTQIDGIDWSRVTAFHMDEYIGLPPEAPQRFSHFLKEHLFDVVRPGQVHLIDGSRSPEAECARYAGLLAEAPIDIVCLGIGENGHIAFNDPPVADFEDKALMKPVELEEACRLQQVNDGCFPELAAVPTHALTLTIPALLSARHLFCTVPGLTKREAVRRTLSGPVSTACPASILRTHADCTLYLDTDSFDPASLPSTRNGGAL